MQVPLFTTRSILQDYSFWTRSLPAATHACAVHARSTDTLSSRWNPCPWHIFMLGASFSSLDMERPRSTIRKPTNSGLSYGSLSWRLGFRQTRVRCLLDAISQFRFLSKWLIPRGLINYVTSLTTSYSCTLEASVWTCSC